MDPKLVHTDEPGAHRALLMLDGKDIARVTTLDLRMRVGSAILTMGGIAGVGTDDEHRGKGYAALLMQASLDWMREAGYDCSVLFGIRNFYHRWGYAPLWADSVLTLSVTEAALLDSPLTLVPCPAELLPQVGSLFNQTNGTRTGSLVRREDWTGPSKGLDWSTGGQVFASVVDDQLVGYVILDDKPGRVEVVELAAAPGPLEGAFYAALIAFCGHQTEQQGLEAFNVHAPLDHPFCLFARRLDGLATLRHARTGGPMGCFVNLGSAFAQLAPELGRRLEHSPKPPSVNSCVSLSTDIGELTLRAKEGRVTVIEGGGAHDAVRLPQSLLMQLVVGYRPFSDLVLEPLVEVAGNPGPLLGLLFPPQWGYIWPTDHF